MGSKQSNTKQCLHQNIISKFTYSYIGSSLVGAFSNVSTSWTCNSCTIKTVTGAQCNSNKCLSIEGTTTRIAITPTFSLATATYVLKFSVYCNTEVISPLIKNIYLIINI